MSKEPTGRPAPRFTPADRRYAESWWRHATPAERRAMTALASMFL